MLAGAEDVVPEVDVEKPELVLDDVDIVDGRDAIELLDVEELMELVTIVVGSEIVLDVVWLLEEREGDELELLLTEDEVELSLD